MTTAAASVEVSIRVPLSAPVAAQLIADWNIKSAITAAIVDNAFLKAGIMPSQAPNGTMSRGGWWHFDFTTRTLTIYPF